MIRFDMDGKNMAIDFTYDMASGSRITIAKILDENNVQYLGFATQDTRDRDVKETGRKIALRRLMQNNKMSRRERTIVWTAYHNRGAQRQMQAAT
jgi:NADPH-dependent glutamate synthase beta subunit-like oxidoreductase